MERCRHRPNPSAPFDWFTSQSINPCARLPFKSEPRPLLYHWLGENPPSPTPAQTVAAVSPRLFLPAFSGRKILWHPRLGSIWFHLYTVSQRYDTDLQSSKQQTAPSWAPFTLYIEDPVWQFANSRKRKRRAVHVWRASVSFKESCVTLYSLAAQQLWRPP